MARSTRDARLETRTSRLKLRCGVRHYRSIASGLALAYRRSAKGYGTWHARLMVAPDRYVHRLVGAADDFRDADGATTLTYFQAQNKARQLAASRSNAAPYSVHDALNDYLAWYQAHRRAYTATYAAAHAHIIPSLGHRPVDKLTAPEIRRWHEAIATAPPRVRKRKKAKEPAFKTEDTASPDYQRRRRQSANRILTILKAALNLAYRDERVESDSAWRRVKPFRSTGAARIRFLTLDECTRLLNACQPPFRDLANVALLTGCRYGELTALKVADFVPEGRCVQIRYSKSGHPRTVPLTDAGADFMTLRVAGKLAEELIFTRSDGSPWGTSHQARPLRDACTAAKIQPAISFHILRHTYASHLAMSGVPLQAIAAVLGHADTRITEKHYAHLQPSFVADVVRAALPAFAPTQATPNVIAPINHREAA